MPSRMDVGMMVFRGSQLELGHEVGKNPEHFANVAYKGTQE